MAEDTGKPKRVSTSFSMPEKTGKAYKALPSKGLEKLLRITDLSPKEFENRVMGEFKANVGSCVEDIEAQIKALQARKVDLMSIAGQTIVAQVAPIATAQAVKAKA